LTGRIYSPASLEALADLLKRASGGIGHRIFLLSDEPYRQLRFDRRGFTSLAALYPWTLISYSYGKVLRAPGQRLGYLALDANCGSTRSSERYVFCPNGPRLVFPNAVMQYAVPDLDKLSIDQVALTQRRDRFMAVFLGAGYSVLVLKVPSNFGANGPIVIRSGNRTHSIVTSSSSRGSMMNAPGYFRISLTASDEMVERALPAFTEVA
jgi:aspartate aminotransferase